MPSISDLLPVSDGGTVELWGLASDTQDGTDVLVTASLDQALQRWSEMLGCTHEELQAAFRDEDFYDDDGFLENNKQDPLDTFRLESFTFRLQQ